MLRNLLLAAMACFFVAVAAMTAALGGCAGRRTPSPASRAAPECSGAPAPFEVGGDARTIARLAAPAEALADVYDADTGGVERMRITILSGTWLLPTSAFQPPAPPRGQE